MNTPPTIAHTEVKNDKKGITRSTISMRMGVYSKKMNTPGRRCHMPLALVSVRTCSVTLIWLLLTTLPKRGVYELGTMFVK